MHGPAPYQPPYQSQPPHQPPYPQPYQPQPPYQPYPPAVPEPLALPSDAEARPESWRRPAAWAVDAALLACVAGLLATMTWARLHSLILDGLWGRLGAATVGLLVSGGDVGEAAADFGAGVWNTIVGDIEQALLLLVLAEFLYHFAGQAWKGRTLGKAALDLRVDRLEGGPPGARRAAGRAFVSTLGGTGVYSLAWALLLEGLFFLSVVAWFAAVAFFAANGGPALFGRRTLADVMASTVVVRAGAYRRAAERARQGAGAAWQGAQAAGQVAGHAVRDHAARVAQAEHARRLQDLGRRSADKVRGAVESRRAEQAGTPPLAPPQAYAPIEPPSYAPPPPGQQSYAQPIGQQPYEPYARPAARPPHAPPGGPSWYAPPPAAPPPARPGGAEGQGDQGR